MGPKLKIQIIIGSTRPNRLSEGVAKWVFDEAKKIENFEVELLDLRNYPLPFFNEPMSPTYLKGQYSDPNAIKWVKKVGEGDAYIIVTPEYNHGYPAVLKNALDYPYFEWNNKPIGFVSYGSVEGARSIEQLRLVSIELQMAPIRNSIHIHNIFQGFEENGQPKDPTLHKQSENFFNQLQWWANVLKLGRENTSR